MQALVGITSGILAGLLFGELGGLLGRFADGLARIAFAIAPRTMGGALRAEWDQISSSVPSGIVRLRFAAELLYAAVTSRRQHRLQHTSASGQSREELARGRGKLEVLAKTSVTPITALLVGLLVSFSQPSGSDLLFAAVGILATTSAVVGGYLVARSSSRTKYR